LRPVRRGRVARVSAAHPGQSVASPTPIPGALRLAGLLHWLRCIVERLPSCAHCGRRNDRGVTLCALCRHAADALMSWLQKLMPARIRTDGTSKRNVPEGLWSKCDNCGAVLYRPE